jgi:hypothetical protein
VVLGHDDIDAMAPGAGALDDVLTASWRKSLGDSGSGHPARQSSGDHGNAKSCDTHLQTHVSDSAVAEELTIEFKKANAVPEEFGDLDSRKFARVMHEPMTRHGSLSAVRQRTFARQQLPRLALWTSTIFHDQAVCPPSRCSLHRPREHLFREACAIRRTRKRLGVRISA